MNAVPKGKIGRLPWAIQEQVHRRLENGEKARRGGMNFSRPGGTRSPTSANPALKRRAMCA